MGKKRILLVDRVDSSKNIGGDTIQINAICEYLEDRGYKVIVSSEVEKILDKDISLDLIIFFNLTKPFELLHQWYLLKEKSVPYVVFPVYWNLKKAIPWNSYVGTLKKIIHLTPEPIFNVLRWAKTVVKKGDGKDTSLYRMFFLKRELVNFLNRAEGIFVNSEAEKEHLIKEFKLSSNIQKIKVIRNGIEEELTSYASDEVSVQLPFTDYICCAGGIGARKNQLKLVKAANESRVNLVIIGSPSKSDIKYYNKIQKAANKNIFFTGYLKRPEMLGIIANAKGHIQPSFIETPGLASIEAAALGCKIAVSDVAPVKEYFGELAIYCNPSSVKSISNCLMELWDSELSDEERNNQLYQIKNLYNWPNVLKPLCYELCKIINA